MFGGRVWSRVLAVLAITAVSAFGMTKFQKWREPSFFRGFNVYWSDYDGTETTIDDFVALKNSGANLAILQTHGFLNPEPPYDSTDSWWIEALDSMVSFCRQVGVYYVISVRTGPGRQDVWEEGEGLVPHSTIWQNETEQQLYAKMLAGMAARYLPDTLFVGMDLIQEPNPFGDSVACMPPNQLDSLYDAVGIDVNHIYTICIESVRTVAPTLPLLVQAVHWSNPGYFSLVQLQEDTLIVYDTHPYEPYDFTHSDTPESENYPGYYWGCAYDWYAFWDRDFFRDTVFAPVRNFQLAHNVPIIVGETGLQWRQNGGRQYLRDVIETAVEFGWHFALWQFRSDSNFNYEVMGADYWATVCSLMTIPSVVVEDSTPAESVRFLISPDPVVDRCVFTVPGGQVEIFDLRGNRVAVVEKPYIWRVPANLRAGVYFARLVWQNRVYSRRIVLLR